MLISTPGSRDGTSCRMGKISSRTYHLSMYSSSLPKHTNVCTRIWRKYNMINIRVNWWSTYSHQLSDHHNWWNPFERRYTMYFLNTLWSSKMATILWTTFWNLFSCIKTINCNYNFSEVCSSCFNWLCLLGSSNDLMPNSQATAWTNADQYLWCHKVTRGHNDPWHLRVLTHWGQDKMEPPFRSRHFKQHLLEWKFWNFKLNFIEICSQGSH